MKALLSKNLSGKYKYCGFGSILRCARCNLGLAPKAEQNEVQVACLLLLPAKACMLKLRRKL